MRFDRHTERGRRARRLLLLMFALPLCSLPLMEEARAQDPGGFGVLPPISNNLSGRPATVAPVGGGAGAMEGDTGGAGSGGSGLLSGLTYRAFGDIAEIYTTNGLGVGSGFAGTGGYRPGSDLITRIMLGFSVSDVRPRFQSRIDLGASGFIYARNQGLSRVFGNLNALANATLIPERLFLNARAFAAPTVVNPLGPLSASGTPTLSGTNTGLRTIYGYSVAPSLLFRIGDYATSNTTVYQQSVFFDGPGATVPSATVPGGDAPLNFVSVGAYQQFTSGDYFARLQWNLLGAYNQAYMPRGNFETRVGMLNTQYAVTRFFSILATVGYQQLISEAVLTRQFAGWTFLGGGQLTLGPNVVIIARGGTMFNRPTYIGSLRIQLTPATGIFGSYTDTIGTPSQRLLGNLGGIGIGGGGNFINTPVPAFGAPNPGFSATPIDGLAIGSLLSRFRMANLALTHSLQRTQFRLTGFYTIRDILTVVPAGTSPRQESLGLMAGVSRSLRPNLTGDLSGAYWTFKFGPSNVDMAQAQVFLTYNASQMTQFYASAAYIRRMTDSAFAAASPVSSSLTGINITIGARRNFL